MLVVAGLFWYVYGDSFEEKGFAGVIEDVQEDVIWVIEHPLVSGTIELVREEVEMLSDRIRENQNEEVLPALKQPDLNTPSKHTFSVYNIELGDTRENVENLVGGPERASLNEYGVDWVAYHDNYHNFIMVAYDEDNLVRGIYTNQDLLTSTNGISFDSTRDEVLATMPEPLDYIRKGLIRYQIQDNGEYNTFNIEDSYVTIFYDKHQDSKVTAVLLIDEELEKQKRTYFSKPSEALREGFEYQLFDLTNAARVKHGLTPLAWEEAARETVRSHSVDMAENDYFSHTNLEGLSPFDRLDEDAISYRMAGENLASGQQSSIFAHEGLMNSPGHRENKLKSGYRSLAVGVAFNSDSQPFYTENYLAK